ncbi:hypothetical protein [Cellvibrio mixtus]|uniref:hypothetical protein n=1 Tax=Cellvibrio mixtus TaxID=39650 RepID=UPI000A44FF84|nr:hypothetical protein [Cellvibrio mixtus]
MLTVIGWVLGTAIALILLSLIAWCGYLALSIVRYLLASLLLPFGVDFFPKR